ncbi:hypothetical protein CBL_03423 [Carabus blaptoides fortunei]
MFRILIYSNIPNGYIKSSDLGLVLSCAIRKFRTQTIGLNIVGRNSLAEQQGTLLWYSETKTYKEMNLVTSPEERQDDTATSVRPSTTRTAVMHNLSKRACALMFFVLSVEVELLSQ